MNRRISLVVLNDKTERQIRGLPEAPMEEIQNEIDAVDVLGGAGGADAVPEAEEPEGGAVEPSVPVQPAAPESLERLAQPAPGPNPA
jgi:hypothetical protein